MRHIQGSLLCLAFKQNRQK